LLGLCRPHPHLQGNKPRRFVFLHCCADLRDNDPRTGRRGDGRGHVCRRATSAPRLPGGPLFCTLTLSASSLSFSLALGFLSRHFSPFPSLSVLPRWSLVHDTPHTRSWVYGTGPQTRNRHPAERKPAAQTCCNRQVPLTYRGPVWLSAKGTRYGASRAGRRRRPAQSLKGSVPEAPAHASVRKAAARRWRRGATTCVYSCFYRPRDAHASCGHGRADRARSARVTEHNNCAPLRFLGPSLCLTGNRGSEQSVLV
jgi:hypothetical protein